MLIYCVSLSLLLRNVKTLVRTYTRVLLPNTPEIDCILFCELKTDGGQLNSPDRTEDVNLVLEHNSVSRSLSGFSRIIMCGLKAREIVRMSLS